MTTDARTLYWIEKEKRDARRAVAKEEHLARCQAICQSVEDRPIYRRSKASWERGRKNGHKTMATRRAKQ